MPLQDETLTLRGVSAPNPVTLLGSGEALKFSFEAATRTLSGELPASRRTTLVDVAKIELRAEN